MSESMLRCPHCTTGHLTPITVTRGAVSGLTATRCVDCGDTRLVSRRFAPEPRSAPEQGGRCSACLKPAQNALCDDCEAVQERGYTASHPNARGRDLTLGDSRPCLVECTTEGCAALIQWIQPKRPTHCQRCRERIRGDSRRVSREARLRESRAYLRRGALTPWQAAPPAVVACVTDGCRGVVLWTARTRPSYCTPCRTERRRESFRRATAKRAKRSTGQRMGRWAR